MSDYESNYMMGILSAIILFVLLCIVFWATSPLWFGFVNGIANAVVGSGLTAIMPQLAPFINNLTLAITTVFFALIATPIVYIILLPFLRQPQQECY